MSSDSSDEFGDLSSTTDTFPLVTKRAHKKPRLVLENSDSEEAGPSGVQEEMAIEQHLVQMQNISLCDLNADDPLLLTEESGFCTPLMSADSELDFTSLPSTSTVYHTPPNSRSTMYRTSTRNSLDRDFAEGDDTPKSTKRHSKKMLPYSELKNDRKRKRKTKKQFQLKLVRSLRNTRPCVAKMYSEYEPSETDSDS